MRPVSFSLIASVLCAAVLPLAPTRAADSAPATARIVLAGDSTVASSSGWGDAFAKLLSPGVECVNLARGGRSSLSFRSEGHWQKVLDAKPTWVLLQFGHNDQPGKGPTRETDPKTTFRANLTRYITEVRAAGAQPVLITSLTRRNYNAQGKIDPANLQSFSDSAGNVKPDNLTEYVEATRAVATEQKVPLLDLNARSIEQLNTMSPDAAATAFDPKPKDPTKPDKTHLSPEGGAKIAALIVAEIRKSAPDLAKLLKP